MVKPYSHIPIQDCGEPLVPLPATEFALVSPHPYQQLGAPYGDKSPFFVRAGVLNALQAAEKYLQQHQPHWQIQIFDAYRPVPVQQFMVDYSFQQLLRTENIPAATLTESQRDSLLTHVYQFWAPPSLNPATPPPHSTGAAIDITLVDGAGIPLDMGTAIDEMSERSFPDYFAGSTIPQEQKFHHHRQLLKTALLEAGFLQHPNEWWHFCLGDQMWAWLKGESVARYGGV